jgi:hypothetical protein
MKAKLTQGDQEFHGSIDMYNEYTEDFTITKEALGRGAILLKMYQERWRTPKETVTLLETIIECIKENFI